MKNRNVVFSLVLSVGNSGLARTRKSKNAYNVLAPIFKIVSFLSPVTGGKSVSIGRSPGQCQCSLFKLPEIAHAQNSRAVMLGIKEGESQRMVFVVPVWIGEDIDIALSFKNPGAFVHFNKMLVNGLEVEQPIIKDILMPLRNQQVSSYHKVFMQANVSLGVVHLLKAGVIDSLAQFGGI